MFQSSLSALRRTAFFLVAVTLSSGAFAQSTYYTNTDDAKILDYLTGNTYSGHGAHSMFMKTWAAACG